MPDRFLNVRLENVQEMCPQSTVAIKSDLEFGHISRLA
jgi:hypothetical protein